MLDIDNLHVSVQDATSVMAHSLKTSITNAASNVLLSHSPAESSHFEGGRLLNYYRQTANQVGLYSINPSDAFVLMYERLGEMMGQQAARATHPEVFLKVVNDLFHNEDWVKLVSVSLLEKHASLSSTHEPYQTLVHTFNECHAIARDVDGKKIGMLSVKL